MNEKTTNIIKTIESILVGIAIFLVVFLLLSMFLPKFKYSLVIIKSGSMEPTIKTGSVIVSKQLDQYQKGDIITFRDMGNTIITHRITEVIENNDLTQFKTKGDDNDSEDMLLANKNSVLGKTIFSIPLLGYLITFAKTPIGIIVIFLLPATWIAFDEVKKIKKVLNTKKQKDEDETDK
jgi:signal peptidase